MLRRMLVSTWLCTLAGAAPAYALTWPDAAIRAEQNLRSPDAEQRRRAAGELVALGSKKAEPLVLKALADPDVEVRVAAASTAVKLRIQGATEVVLPWLGDPELRLRTAACDVAAALPDDRATTPLARTLGDTDPTVRARAATALGRQHSKEAVAPLLGHLDDPNPSVRVEVLRSLSKLRDPRSVVPLIGKAQDSVLEVKKEALRALGELGDVRALQPLTSALRDPSPEIKIEALSALGVLRQDSTVDAVTLLLTDRNTSVRQGAAAALGAIGTKRSAAALANALGGVYDESLTHERTPLRQALASTREHAFAACEKVLTQPKNRSALAGCAWVAGELGAASLSPAIVAAMRRGTLPPANALLALRGTRNPSDLPTVLEYLSDPSDPTRRAAIAAATALLDPAHPDGRAVDPILQRLEEARVDAAERAALATLLGRTGSPRSVKPLLALASHSDREVRLSAISSLGSVKPEGDDIANVTEALFKALIDPDASIRFRSSIALGNTGSSATLERVLHALEGAEIEHASLLRTLAPLVARVGTDAQLGRVEKLFELASPADRDALYEVFARTTSARASATLLARSTTEDRVEQRAISNAIALHPAPATVRLLRSLMASPSAEVAAEALWSAGSSPHMLLSDISNSLRAKDPDVRANAVASLARAASRVKQENVFPERACSLLGDPFPLVRANALVGLALTHQRCGDGMAERALVGADPSPLVRAAASRALRVTPSGMPSEDERVLHQCARSEPDAAVANACSEPATVNGDVEPVTFFVIDPKTGSASPHTRYVVRYANGFYRVGTTDRRGAAFDPAAPKGELGLVRVDETSQGRMR